MERPLAVRLHHRQGVPVLQVAGDLDVETSHYLMEAAWTSVEDSLNSLAAAAPVMVLDASAISFVDSAGLGAVVYVLKRVRAHHGGLSVVGAGEQLLDLLALTGLNKVVALHATVQEAIRAAVGDTAGTD